MASLHLNSISPWGNKFDQKGSTRLPLALPDAHWRLSSKLWVKSATIVFLEWVVGWSQTVSVYYDESFGNRDHKSAAYSLVVIANIKAVSKYKPFMCQRKQTYVYKQDKVWHFPFALWKYVQPQEKQLSLQTEKEKTHGNFRLMRLCKGINLFEEAITLS